jgi:pimeloyl-ACP methyl ester carboxylesterase
MILASELTGPTGAVQIVLIHGITESRHSWGAIAERLAETFRVLAVDLRGHGDSPNGDSYDPMSYASDVIDTVAAANPAATSPAANSAASPAVIAAAKPLVIGHSLGGVVASAVAALGGAHAVINVDQPLRLAEFKDGLAQIEPMLRGTNETFTAAIDAMFAMMAGPLSESERTRIAAHRRPNRDVVLGTWASVLESTPEELDATVEQLATAITVPYLAIHGLDPGDSYAPWLTALVPTATVELWPDHGHYPHLVDPDRFIDLATQFWNSSK